MSYARRALIVAWKDLVVERRSKETLNALLFFSLALLFVFQFTLGPDRDPAVQLRRHSGHVAVQRNGEALFQPALR